MELRRLWTLAAIPFILMACEAEEEAVEQPVTDVAVAPAPAPAPAPAAGAAGEVMVNMQPLNNSGVTGQGTITPMAGQTQVTVQLNAPAGGTTHQGHIHQGTCDSLGSVVQPLQPITLDATGSGTMTTTVPVDPMTVTNGQHIIVYHEAGGDPGAPIVCGSIPQHTM